MEGHVAIGTHVNTTITQLKYVWLQGITEPNLLNIMKE